MPTIIPPSKRLDTNLNQDALREAGVGAFFRPAALGAVGIGYRQLRELVRSGRVEHVAHGLYRLAEAEPTEDYTLAAVCAQAPESIVCLLTALRVHDIGTRVPHEVWLAIPHKARPPRFRSVRVRLVRFSAPAWAYGVVETRFEGVPARITNPARTIVDCFRFERLVGREASLEALRDGLREKKVSIDAIFRTLQVLPSRRLRTALEMMP